MNPSLKLFIIIALIVFVPILIAHKLGYFGKKGQLQPSKKATALFRNNKLPAHYRYFERSDSMQGTYAIAGIEPEYTIDSNGWNPWQPDEDSLDRLIQLFVMQNTYVPEGYDILTPDKKAVGIFYSSLPDPAVHFKSRRFIKFTLDIPQHIRQEQ